MWRWTLKQITLWSVITKDKDEEKLDFNHFEDGWSFKDSPLSIYRNQTQKWKNNKWNREYAYLNDAGKVIHGDIYPKKVKPFVILPKENNAGTFA